MKSFPTVDYAPLLTDSNEDEKEKCPDDELSRKSVLNPAMVIFFGCVGCTLTSLLLAGFALPIAKQSTNLPAKNAILPRPNQYIGLDVVDYSSFQFESIVNTPHILTQVTSEQPDFVFPDDSRRWLSWIGVVSPDDRHFLINSTVSSIAQFRVLDYKMEDCQVAINIPSAEEMLKTPSAIVGAPGNKSDFTISPSQVRVQVWKLSTETDLRLSTLSWKTRPSREKLIETLVVSQDHLAITSSFPCPQDSLQTLEFACETPSNCLIDLWQDKKEPRLGS